jgi:CRP-like cAMP-binding protein
MRWAEVKMNSIEELKDLIANNSLFNKMKDSDLESMLAVVSETRDISKGEYLLQEDEEADEIFLVKTGLFEVLKNEDGTGTMHRLAVINPGMSIGEVSLLDSGRRSASIRAVEDSSVLVIPIVDLEKLSNAEHTIDIQMKINLAHEMGRRLRETNESTVRTLREKLNESEKRAEMGRFMSRVLIGTCLYMFALGATKALSQYLPDTTMVTVPILLAFAFGLAINIKTSAFPASAYGFTTKNWKPALKEAFLFSLPVAALIVLSKYILTLTMPQLEGAPVFDLYKSKGLDMGTILLMALFYCCFAPIQEMIARSGMQSSFQMFLTGKYKTVVAIFLSTLLFSSTHLHVSLSLALLVFPLGLFWGWLYARNPTLIGVSASHVMLGLFGLFIVGFPTRG